MINVESIGQDTWVLMKQFRGPKYWKLREAGIDIGCSDDGEMLWLSRDGKHLANVWSDIYDQPHWIVSEPTLHSNFVNTFPNFFEDAGNGRVIGKKTHDHGYVVTEYPYGGGMIGLKRSADSGMEMCVSKSVFDVPYLVTDKPTIHVAVIKKFPELFEEVDE